MSPVDEGDDAPTALMRRLHGLMTATESKHDTPHSLGGEDEEDHGVALGLSADLSFTRCALTASSSPKRSINKAQLHRAIAAAPTNREQLPRGWQQVVMNGGSMYYYHEDNPSETVTWERPQARVPNPETMSAY